MARPFAEGAGVGGGLGASRRRSGSGSALHTLRAESWGLGLWLAGPPPPPPPPPAPSPSSMVCAETGGLVEWEPQLWGSRGPFFQALLSPTLGTLTAFTLYSRILRHSEVMELQCLLTSKQQIWI